MDLDGSWVLWIDTMFERSLEHPSGVSLLWTLPMPEQSGSVADGDVMPSFPWPWPSDQPLKRCWTWFCGANPLLESMESQGLS